ncbi:Myotubularin-like phosphatase domain [Nesidiocoris tenuis]|uniref:Myotubularin-like phosphatase domain n=1 Tax=Nesidiocoris tenuis TaxID=355587 RepID=A0ABN7AZ07_9HEMI|nr:Myotubularin-like phosphatase domain [Nesidiocoris tenuis]
MEFIDLILVPKLDNVVFSAPFQKPLEGTLCITGHHILLSARSEIHDEQVLLHDNVDCIEKKSTNNSPGGFITLKCKDLRIISFHISSSDQDFQNVCTTLECLSALDKLHLKYPFFYRPDYSILEDGWTDFSPEHEFSKLVNRDEWRISYVNSEFSICPTYPKVVVVPKGIDDETIVVASRFREGGRFPVLSYRHEGGAALIRSSQPLTGPNNRRSREDERLINSVITNSGPGYIVDTRSSNASQAAKARGGGYEVEMHYPQWKRVNSNIERHQNWLESFSKLMEACNDTSLPMDKWLSKLESSSWLTHVQDVLTCACTVSQLLDKDKVSVLVHGGAGTDSTLLVTSLTQIILNPDCRTVRGFQAIVEREWLQAGYPFSSRHRKSCYSQSYTRNKQEAPSFLLFLDCVHQIHTQFPCSFEFSVQFLIWLFEHSYASQFGTFLGNNAKDRDEFKLSSTTTSLWSYLNQPDVLRTILNPMYEPNNAVIWPSVAPVSLNVWSELYLRWVIDLSVEKQAWVKIGELKNKEQDLRSTAVKLRRQLAELEKELAQAEMPHSNSEDSAAESNDAEPSFFES